MQSLKSLFFKFNLLNLSTLQRTYVYRMSDNFIPNINLVIKVKILLPIKVMASSSSLPPEPLYLLPNIKSLFFDSFISSSKYLGSNEWSALYMHPKLFLAFLNPSIIAEPYPFFFELSLYN